MTESVSDLNPQEILDNTPDTGAENQDGVQSGDESTDQGGTPDAEVAKADDATGGSDDDNAAEPDSGEPEPKPEPEPQRTAEPKPEPKEEIDLDKYKLDDIPEDYEPKSWKEALELAEERAYKRIKGEDAQQAKTKADENAAKDAALQEINAGYDRELVALETDGRLPKGDDGLKRQAEVWQYMNTENARREKAGIPFFINSFEDALDKLETQESKATAKEQEDKAAQERKAKGSMIGGTSGPRVQPSTTEGLRKGMSLDDILESEGY